MKDSLGQELFAGDCVVWASRQGSGCNLHHGVITDATPKGKDQYIEVLVQDYRWNYDVTPPEKVPAPYTARPYAMHKLMKVTGFPQ